MLQHIPTHVISGALGAGKTSVLRSLLAQRPRHERWAVLINEFGDIGLDSALLDGEQAGVSFTEVAGGCVCCVNGVPFQVALVQLLRKAKPDRLFIEPSGLGHPLQLLEQLRDVPWLDVLAVQPMVWVLDGHKITEAIAQDTALLAHTGLVVINKAEQLTPIQEQHWQTTFAPLPVLCTRQGQVNLQVLPGHDQQAGQQSAVDNFAKTPPAMGAVWTDPRQPICSVNDQTDGWSIGWRWHPSQQFDLLRVQLWLSHMAWQRAKCVLHTNAGWLSGNALEGQSIHWQNTEWRKDSRLELIFTDNQNSEQLSAELAACRIDV